MKNQCLATKAIMESGAKVGYMFREAPDFDGDTGWRIFTGNESLDFIDQDDNIEICEISAVARLNPNISKYLDSPIGIELERKSNTNEFIKVESE